MASTNPNGIIYLEIDEDITSAIDKLSKNSSDSVQIVTAKRSTLFQSLINMKLLKKAAADNNKVLTLVTADRVATNLAGRVGVPVAERVGEPGRVPPAAGAVMPKSDDEIDGGTVGGAAEDDSKKAAVVGGAVAGATAAAASSKAAGAAGTTDTAASASVSAPESKSLPVPAASASAAKPAAAAASAAKSKTKKIPNIGIMQKRVLWIAGGIFAVLLLLGLNYYFTNAKVTLFARGMQVNGNFKFTADPSSQTSNIDTAVLAATQVKVEKNLKGSVTATGTKDNGTKAHGTMTVFNRTNNDQKLVAGTRFQSPDGKIFRSTADVTVPKAYLQNFNPVAGQANVDVSADQNGDGFNLGPAKYSIPALGGDQVYGQGGQMSGGTTKTSKVITQADVDKAKQAAIDADKADVQKQLEEKADKDQVLLVESIKQNVTKTDANPEVGSEAPNGTVNIEITYSALAVMKSDLSNLTRSQVQSQIGEDKEIYDDGSDNLVLAAVGAPAPSGAQSFDAKASAFAGNRINKDELAKAIKGKKYGEATEIANQTADVERTEITITPSWATRMPGIQKHIKIEVKVSNR